MLSRVNDMLARTHGPEHTRARYVMAKTTRRRASAGLKERRRPSYARLAKCVLGLPSPKRDLRIAGLSRDVCVEERATVERRKEHLGGVREQLLAPRSVAGWVRGRSRARRAVNTVTVTDCSTFFGRETVGDSIEKGPKIVLAARRAANVRLTVAFFDCQKNGG